MRDDGPSTRDLVPEALAMARDVRGRLPLLFESFEDHAGWRSHAPGIWSRRGETCPVFKTELTVDAPPLPVAAAIKEADIGGMAGELLQWRVGRLSPFTELVHYVTRYPAPLAPRDFCVTERYGVEEDGGVVILGQDLSPGDRVLVKPGVRAIAEWHEAGSVRGRVICAAAWAQPVPGGTRLRRVVELDPAISLPYWVCERVLAAAHARDTERLTALVRGFRGSALEARAQQDWFYKVVRAHTE